MPCQVPGEMLAAKQTVFPVLVKDTGKGGSRTGKGGEEKWHWKLRKR